MAIKNVDDLFVTAANIAARVRQDKKFAKAVREDPAKALKPYRLGNDGLRTLVMEDAWLKEKVGASIPGAAEGDCPFTCLSSDGCCITCWIGSSTSMDPGSITSNPADRYEFGGRLAKLKATPERTRLLNVLIERGHFTTPGVG